MQKVLSIEGLTFPIQEPQPDKSVKIVDLTVGKAIRIALNEVTLDAEDEAKKMDHLALSRKIFKCGPDENLTISTEVVTTIIAKCRKRWHVEAFGFIYEVLEGINNDFKDISTASEPDLTK